MFRSRHTLRTVVPRRTCVQSGSVASATNAESSPTLRGGAGAGFACRTGQTVGDVGPAADPPVDRSSRPAHQVTPTASATTTTTAAATRATTAARRRRPGRSAGSGASSCVRGAGALDGSAGTASDAAVSDAAVPDDAVPDAAVPAQACTARFACSQRSR
ncbi:hypothetical protein GCM10025868_27690 [Angustibacter aerolatus]|uniref:Uncharacterized protein n=1 Tax=Angustibacter aerolatus TaxID=1162965 RepID=A0ABQ6JJG1_9ACTN|nr:hypothetical protein GCM10025868_27690 [Angustibacter aerolatus]